MGLRASWRGGGADAELFLRIYVYTEGGGDSARSLHCAGTRLRYAAVSAFALTISCPYPDGLGSIYWMLGQKHIQPEGWRSDEVYKT